MFSSRLDWVGGANPLGVAEERRRAAGAELLDLTVTNPTAAGLGAPAAALAAALADPAVAQYLPAPLGPAAARAAVAGEYARLGAAVDPGQVALTASSSESYALLFKLLADPGGVVLVPQPSYPLFDLLARLEGLTTRPYRLVFAGGEWHVDWSSVDLAGVRAAVVVSPNNPTGSCLRPAEWQRFAALAADRGVPLIVDEVFADYLHGSPGDLLRTVAAAPTPALTFALGGLSKSCGLPQLKLGWLVALGPPALTRAALAGLELAADTYLSVAAPVLCALPRLLALGGELRAAIRARLDHNLATLARALAPAGPVSALPSQGGWSAILRLPAGASDEAWALRLLEADGVLVQPGYLFDLPGPGSPVVLSLLTPPATFAEGLARLAARISS